MQAAACHVLQFLQRSVGLEALAEVRTPFWTDLVVLKAAGGAQRGVSTNAEVRRVQQPAEHLAELRPIDAAALPIQR